MDYTTNSILETIKIKSEQFFTVMFKFVFLFFHFCYLVLIYYSAYLHSYLVMVVIILQTPLMFRQIFT